jgi:hypothetical protein
VDRAVAASTLRPHRYQLPLPATADQLPLPAPFPSTWVLLPSCRYSGAIGVQT